MRRFMLFFGDVYYARGGAHDFEGDFDTLEEASEVGKRATAEGGRFEWWHVFDTQEKKVVAPDGSAHS